MEYENIINADVERLLRNRPTLSFLIAHGFKIIFFMFLVYFLADEFYFRNSGIIQDIKWFIVLLFMFIFFITLKILDIKYIIRKVNKNELKETIIDEMFLEKNSVTVKIKKVSKIDMVTGQDIYSNEDIVILKMPVTVKNVEANLLILDRKNNPRLIVVNNRDMVERLVKYGCLEYSVAD